MGGPWGAVLSCGVNCAPLGLVHTEPPKRHGEIKIDGWGEKRNATISYYHHQNFEKRLMSPESAHGAENTELLIVIRPDKFLKSQLE